MHFLSKFSTYIYFYIECRCIFIGTHEVLVVVVYLCKTYLYCWRREQPPGKELEKYDYSGMNHARLPVTLSENERHDRVEIELF